MPPQEAAWLILTICTASLAAAVSDWAPAPLPGEQQQHCLQKCGHISIPYPFGVGPGCSLPGHDNFNLNCTNDKNLYVLGNLLVLDIKLETAELRVSWDTVTYLCVNKSKQVNLWNMDINLSWDNSPYLLSPTRNTFTGVGCGARAKFIGNANTRYQAGCLAYCDSVSEAAEDGAPCKGLGCCEAAITPGLTLVNISWNQPDDVNESMWEYNQCQYALVAENGWYTFSRNDLGGKFQNKSRNWAVPLVLDWAIRNDSCPPEGRNDVSYGACVSAHSHCVNASSGMKGYFCNCVQGYSGNPYQINGCKNINECELRKSPNSKVYTELYPCKGGTCHDTEGGYECKCNFGRRGDGKSYKGCEPILPLAAVVVIGIIVVVSFLAVLLMFIHMEQEKRKHIELFNRNGGELLKSIQIEIFTQDKLDKVTKNYSNIIGRGGFGHVYLGTINENMLVAVKRSIKIDETQKKDFFVNEITIQSQLSHKNLVKLLGCCLETDVPMLVYQFIPKGSLYDVLHGITRYPLPLETRLNIAVHSAEALEYMHVHANQKILHGDVKSGNILLDDHFMPKVSDFGISRLLSLGKDHTNVVIGDISYMDPVYMKTGRLTEKSDVYSFGIVLLELITRKKVRYDDDKSLTIEFIKAYKAASGAKHIYDNEIIDTDVDIVCVENIGLIAVRCLQDDVDERPLMTEVVKELEMVGSEWLKTKGPM